MQPIDSKLPLFEFIEANQPKYSLEEMDPNAGCRSAFQRGAITEKWKFNHEDQIKGAQYHYPEGFNFLDIITIDKDIKINFIEFSISEKIVDINQVDSKGLSALHCAAFCKDLDAGFDGAKALVKAGANVNLNANCISALWIAAEKTFNIKLIGFLLLKGGKIFYPLSNIGRNNVDAAIQQLVEKPKLLFRGLVDKESPLTYIPEELLTNISMLYISVLYPDEKTTRKETCVIS